MSGIGGGVAVVVQSSLRNRAVNTICPVRSSPSVSLPESEKGERCSHNCIRRRTWVLSVVGVGFQGCAGKGGGREVEEAGRERERERAGGGTGG